MAATTQRLSFVDNMWEGVEQIKEKTEVGLKSCRDVLDFFKRLATLEEEYAKNVSGLIQRYQPSNSALTLSQGWKSVITVLEGQAGMHKSLSVNFVTNLCHPLQALLKDMENRRKQLVTDSAKQKAELRDHIELVKKAKLRYDKCSKDLETARNELSAAKAQVTEQDPQQQRISKLEKNVSAKESECNTAETQYKLQVQQSNQFLDSYQEEKWPYILNEFEQFEVTRISFMKANIHNFMGLLKEMPSILESEVAAGLKTSEAIDPEVDLQLFIDQNKSPKELLNPFVFEPYTQIVQKSQPSSRPISQIWDNFRFPLGSRDEPTPAKPAAQSPPQPSLNFGVSLAELMEKQQKDEPTLQIPKIVAVLTEGMVTLNGFDTEGMFRLAGSASEVQNLRKQLDKGEYTITGTQDPHVLGSVLKQFLRELPEAVIPTSFYDECVSGQTTPTDLIEKLPPLNKTVLLYILNFLQIFIKPAHLQHNKMTASNLSTIFATILLRSPQKEPTALLAGLTNELTFVEKLILTAPLLPQSQFPIFAILHQTSKDLPTSPAPPVNPASKQAQAITASAFSPPTSPTVTGDVAYSTQTDPSSVTDFDDMSDKDDLKSDGDNKGEGEKIDDFENDDDTATPKDDEPTTTTSTTSPQTTTAQEGKESAKEGQRQLGSSSEFVIVPATQTSSES